MTIAGQSNLTISHCAPLGFYGFEKARDHKPINHVTLKKYRGVTRVTPLRDVTLVTFLNATEYAQRRAISLDGGPGKSAPVCPWHSKYEMEFSALIETPINQIKA